jgi:hypothetical protein
MTSFRVLPKRSRPSRRVKEFVTTVSPDEIVRTGGRAASKKPVCTVSGEAINRWVLFSRFKFSSPEEAGQILAPETRLGEPLPEPFFSQGNPATVRV